MRKCYTVGFENEGRAHNQGIQVTSRARKDKEMDLSPEMQAC
jgi:hypothetical protein